ncbi:MAG: hypothetical protein E6772_08505 [Dysgonomonas sp.]|nr:hypothetical protein [Dysgonomonas sp.]
MDGFLRRKIYYNNGEIDFRNKEREIPMLVFDSDSLKVGIKTNIRAINLYSGEPLSSNNFIEPSKEKGLFDFVIVPSNKDSVHFYYYHPYIMDGKPDTVKIKASELKNPSEYGLSEVDIKNNRLVSIIRKKSKVITLVSLPVYE